MLVPQVVEGEVTTVATQHQKTHKPRRAKRGRDTEIPQFSGPLKKLGDEVVYTREDDRVVRAATTASSLEAEQESDAHTRFETASKKSHDPPLSEGNTSGSEEANMEHLVDLMDFVPPTPHDSPLSGGHTPRSDDDCSRLGDPKAEKESQKIGKGTKGKNSRDEALQDWYLHEKSVAGPSHVSTAGPSNVSVAGPSTSTAGDILEDEMTTIADTLVAIRSARPRTTSVMIRNVKEETRRATPVDLIAERKKFFAAQRAEQIRNKPPTRAQLRNKMKLYEKEHKRINDFVPLDSEMVKDSGKEDGDSQKQAESSKKRSRAKHDEESVKKHELEDEAEREELRACLDIVQGDDIAMDFESLATKYLIIDWKTHILTENIMYYQIIREDGSSKNYKIFSKGGVGGNKKKWAFFDGGILTELGCDRSLQAGKRKV
ncbi:hypothetical protein Tco_1173941 [Tanacetum coccineum]